MLNYVLDSNEFNVIVAIQINGNGLVGARCQQSKYALQILYCFPSTFFRWNGFN